MTTLDKLRAAGIEPYTDAEIETVAEELAIQIGRADGPQYGRLLVTLLEKRPKPADEPERYLLLSFKRGAWGNEAVWWGPYGGGYYSRIEHAGRYSEEEARKIERQALFDMGRKDTVAVPESEVLESATLMVDYNHAVKRWAIEEDADGQE